jgi:hypothetical protein
MSYHADLTRAEAIALIEAATGPAGLFGTGGDAGESAGRGGHSGGGAGGDSAGRRYRRLARLTHPDACPGDRRAAAAFAKLAGLWRRYGEECGPLAARGDIANLYLVRPGLLKLARDPADNDLMRREAVVLTQLRAAVEPRFGAYFPRLVQTRRRQEPGSGIQRHANVIGWLPGFVSLAEVSAAFPAGVDARDAVWMWRRLLVAIGAAHRAGIIHGAVLPEHVLIQPAEHGLVLIDWCYSVPAPAGRLAAVPGRYRAWYPPEVLAGRPPGPDLDIWLATRCMTELTGAALPDPLASFAAGCTLASPRRRPDDAWQLLAEFDDLLERLYGPRRFRPFAMPA